MALRHFPIPTWPISFSRVLASITVVLVRDRLCLQRAFLLALQTSLPSYQNHRRRCNRRGIGAVSSLLWRDDGPARPAERKRRRQYAHGGEVDLVCGSGIGLLVPGEPGPKGGGAEEGSREPERAVGVPGLPGRREGDLREPPLSAPRRAPHRHWRSRS